MLPLQYRDLFSFGGLGLRVRALKKGLMIQATWLRVKLLTAVVMLAAGWTDSATGPQPRSHLECCSATQDVKLQPLPPKCAATLEAVLHPVHANSGRQPPLVGGKGPGTMRGAMHLYHAPGDLRNSGIGPALGAGGQRPAGAHATGATLLSPCTRGGGMPMRSSFLADAASGPARRFRRIQATHQAPQQPYL